MADDRYLEGDPDAVNVVTRDLTPFVSGTFQNATLVADLIQAGRFADAFDVACEIASRAKAVLKDTETPLPPLVDVERSDRIYPYSARKFKGQDG